jgi:hypothetical protein
VLPKDIERKKRLLEEEERRKRVSLVCLSHWGHQMIKKEKEEGILEEGLLFFKKREEWN